MFRTEFTALVLIYKSAFDDLHFPSMQLNPMHIVLRSTNPDEMIHSCTLCFYLFLLFYKKVSMACKISMAKLQFLKR